MLSSLQALAGMLHLEHHVVFIPLLRELLPCLQVLLDVCVNIRPLTSGINLCRAMGSPECGGVTCLDRL